MAVFSHYGSPKIGDIVEGKYGKHKVSGVVIPHPKFPSKPFVIRTRYGAVLCYVATHDGRKVACNELRLLEKNHCNRG